MEVLTRARVPFLVGGTFAFVHQAGIDRSTKDLDIFVRPCRRPSRCWTRAPTAGYEADLVFSHWLAKIRSPSGFIDVIFSSGNGVAVVDDGWFEHATEREVARRPGAGGPAGGERLVQGLRHGAGAVRRRGRRPHHPGASATGSTGAG